MKEIRLFDYQQEMLENITEVFSAAVFDSVLYNEKRKRVNVGSSVMVQMPTGTGKTYVMAVVVRWFLETYSKGEVWLIAYRKELVEQMERTLDRFALDYGEKDDELTAKVRIRVLSIQWLTRNIGDLEKNGFRPGLIIVDEAHHSLATSYQDVFIRNHKALKIGMTATPCRMKQASFGTLFSRLITSPSTRDFIMRGYLASYNYVVIGMKSTDQQIINQLKGRGSDGDYSIKEMDEKLNIPPAIRRLYNSVMKYAAGKKGIVYAIDIDHAKAIAECYNALGIKAVALDSKTAAKTRKKAVEAFREGELDCLVNVNLFDEGFDCPDVEYIQMARPTLSLAKILIKEERLDLLKDMFEHEHWDLWELYPEYIKYVPKQDHAFVGEILFKDIKRLALLKEKPKEFNWLLGQIERVMRKSAVVDKIIKNGIRQLIADYPDKYYFKSYLGSIL